MGETLNKDFCVLAHGVHQIPDGLVWWCGCARPVAYPQLLANGTINFPGTGADATWGTAFKVEGMEPIVSVLPASWGECCLFGRERDFFAPASGAIVIVGAAMLSLRGSR